jgi:hypothetical protein
MVVMVATAQITEPPSQLPIRMLPPKTGVVFDQSDRTGAGTTNPPTFPGPGEMMAHPQKRAASQIPHVGSASKPSGVDTNSRGVPTYILETRHSP